MTLFSNAWRFGSTCCAVAAVLAAAQCHAAGPTATRGLSPNREGMLDHAVRYAPDGSDFVITNGIEFFNRPLYGGHTAFRVDGGDKPEFALYLPGRGGNLRLGIRTRAGTKWLHDAATVVTRYRPGELHYEIHDPVLGAHGSLYVVALAYASTEGLVVRTAAKGLSEKAELIWAYGGVNGQRGQRDGDIGTERVPISDYFQFTPALGDGNAIALGKEGFTLTAPLAKLKGAASIVGLVPAGSVQHLADASLWNDLPALLNAAEPGDKAPVVLGRAALRNGQALLLSLQRTDRKPIIYNPAGSLDDALQVSSVPVTPYTRAQLPAAFSSAQRYFADLRGRVAIDTPDPYLNTVAGAINVVSDALWDDDSRALMHGSIAWRTKYLGWRGPYALNDLGWHDRARINFGTYTAKQNTKPIPEQLPLADVKFNLARSQTALNSNGDMQHSNYDMNMVFVDAIFRHLQWTGDLAYAREVWPVIERHLAWEKRLFRREYGPDKLPLYEAYAAIWASDDLYYGGSGTTHSSAYNHYAFRSAARLARLLGKDGSDYDREADLIGQAMRKYLWMPERGAFGEYRDLLGLQRLHPSYGLWTFYHTVDSEVPSAQETWRMAMDLKRHLKPIPVTGPGVPADAAYAVLPTTDWMPYSWSINNVVMGENLHTALALWQSGDVEDAYRLAKSALMASMYMGITPGNMGSMNYLDANRRESQRDFADATGVAARALVEGLFGIRPDALVQTLTVHPGFPAAWNHASLRHPDVGLAFRRDGRTERWRITQASDRFAKLVLRVPARYNRVKQVTVNGKAVTWQPAPEAVGSPALLVQAPMGRRADVVVTWAGAAIDAAPARALPGAGPADLVMQRSGDFHWLAATAASKPAPATPAFEQPDWSQPRPGASFTRVDLGARFNDSVTEIFKPAKYLSPRSPFTSLSIPSQGLGAWAAHYKDTPVIDDTGLRAAAGRDGGVLVMPNGVGFATPSMPGQRNIAFTSRWDNYPTEVTVPVCGTASDAWLLMAGSTNFMQSRIDNGEVVVAYADGSSSRLPLVNPGNWWPIEQDYFIDDYQFNRPGPRPPRIDLKTGKIRLNIEATSSGTVSGGAATALHMPLAPDKALRSLTVRTLSNDVVIGLMALTLEHGPSAGGAPAVGAACDGK